MKITFGPDRLHGKVKKLLGFAGLNVGRSGATGPWVRLKRVGYGAIPKDNRPYTGNYEFFVNDGGIDHDALSKHHKKVFREDVLPAIIQSFPDLKNKFYLTLHYNVDELIKVTLNDEKLHCYP